MRVPQNIAVKWGTRWAKMRGSQTAQNQRGRRVCKSGVSGLRAEVFRSGQIEVARR
jgi:hypothetical protein